MSLLGKLGKSKKKKDASLVSGAQGNSMDPPSNAPGMPGVPPVLPGPNNSANGAAVAGDPNNQSQRHERRQDGQKAVPYRPKFQFHCQLAQGSPTGIICDFTSAKELYVKIAEAFGIDEDSILFCTLNTHKIDMTKLLGGQIGVEDFIFAHVKDQPKEIEIMKSEDALGLTITDNGNGLAFIKRIKEGSIMDREEYVRVGDHIEKINGKKMVPCRHYEVARMLKEIPRNEKFTIRLVEPNKTELANVALPSRGSKKKNVKTGKATIRLKGSGIQEQIEDDVVEAAVTKIDELLESFMGVADNDLARSIYEVGEKINNNPSDFALAIDDAFGEFGFSDNFIFDAWGAIQDAKKKHLDANRSQVEFDEQF